MYDLAPDKLKGIANLCKQEQGSWQGAAAEATLASNILRTSSTYKAKFGNDIYSFMRNSGWFSRAAYWMDNGDAGNDYVSIVRDVLVNGYFTLPIYVNEHDCFSDILWAKNGDEPIDKRNRSEYIPHLTRIRNKYGSEYTFFAFPAPNSDPFGYTDSNRDKYMKNITVLSVLSLAKSWLGRNEADGTHEEIINIYNSHTPLARGYKVKYTDKWCATFVSAVFIKLGVYDFAECGCPEMIRKFKALGMWNGKACKGAGDIVFYDWGGDGVSDHVGIVEVDTGEVISVIEGNYKDAVGRRTIRKNSTSILGYARPFYVSGKKEEAPSKTDFHFETVKKGDENGYVRILEIFMQAFGYYDGPIDSIFGDGLYAAVCAYQSRRINEGFDIGTDGKPDGVCGGKMWNDLMGV